MMIRCLLRALSATEGRIVEEAARCCDVCGVDGVDLHDTVGHESSDADVACEGRGLVHGKRGDECSEVMWA